MKIKLTFLSMALAAVTINCTKDNGVVDSLPLTKTDNAIAAEYGTREVYFNHSDGLYSLSRQNSDFGNFLGSNFNQYGNARIASNQLRVRIPRDTHSDTENAPNGNSFSMRIDIPDGTDYEVSYRMKFDANFSWVRGGKCGLGFRIGSGWSGCSTSNKGIGASARITWGNPNKNATEFDTSKDAPYLSPYLYFADKTDDCGANLGDSKKLYNLKKNVWYDVYMRVKSNTGTTKNGLFLLKINGATIAEKTNMQWTTTNTGGANLIKELTMENFRGGASTDHQSDLDGFINYDNIKWKKLN